MQTPRHQIVRDRRAAAAIAWALIAYVLAITLLSLSGVAHAAPPAATAPTTRPRRLPVLAWFQPARNIPMLAAMGVDTFVGPEVENGKNLTPEALAAARAAWVKSTQDNRAKCVVKDWTGPLPPNCVGVMLSKDEPNGKGIPPAALLGERDDLRARYPGVPIWLSLAGDKITSANFAKRAADGTFPELQLMKDFGADADVLSVNCYSKNRNEKYPTTWVGDAVKKAADATGKPVAAWIEVNDQQLDPPPAPAINREPTEDEIQAEADYAIDQGAYAIGIFATCDRGRYGWSFVPGKGDSYWPLINRAGKGLQPQLARVASICLSRTNASAAAIPSATDVKLQALDAAIAALEESNRQLLLRGQDTDRRLNNAFKAAAAAAAATQPTTQPTGAP